MVSIKQLRKEKEKLVKIREKQFTKFRTAQEKKKLKKEIKELKSPKKTALKRIFGRAVKTGGKLVLKGSLIAGKSAYKFGEKITRPTPTQIASYKRAMRKRK